MSPKKGNIGHRPGKKRSCRQKKVSNSSIVLKNKTKLITGKCTRIKISVEGLVLSLDNKDDERLIEQKSNQTLKKETVKVSVTGLLLSLDNKHDERLIVELSKETSKCKSALTKTQMQINS